ncbi:phosphoribosylglycinamide formyltransferase [Glonium stellatum]|uniref:Phosphoribosylglycinamide formyltransferase n=1 Tax=Glonium stellatum TaxID=574774 RepID=A0A8E2F992_9PEZI|nr:phosphoribosylglycinamide formyltransferase [Glonium stellatum]
MSKPTYKLTVLISGNGTNLQALIDACTSSALPSTRIVRVISNRKSAYGLTRAATASIPTAYHNLQPYKKQHPDTADGISAARSAYDADLAALVLADAPDLVVCAGWMHILAPSFLTPLAAAEVPVINLHPALPGEFAGAGAIERAWEAFRKGEVKKTGVMIHEVIAEVDAGRPIVVEEVKMREGETLEELEERMHKVEHGLIVEGTKRTLKEIEERRTKRKSEGEVW